jgi:hypothetical protein
MTGIGPILSMGLALYALDALATGIFLISENRRPQATLAWMLVFVFAPGIGVLVYVLFGRGRKAFGARDRNRTIRARGHREDQASRNGRGQTVHGAPHVPHRCHRPAGGKG